jgi:cytochrome c peroxidase
MMKKIKILFGLCVLLTFCVHCTKNNQDVSANLKALPLDVPSPSDNPQTAQKASLGKLLFWDPVLSGNKDVACASCHHPSQGYSDGLSLSIGVNGEGLGPQRHFRLPNDIPFAKRNAFTIVNTAFNGMAEDGTCDPSTAAMFFDNRTRSLELQSLEPIKSLEEMKGRSIASSAILDTIVLRLKNIPQYAGLFSEAFGTSDAVTTQNLRKAIAAYERTLIANHAPYDEYMRGNGSAMTATQVQGMNAFVANGCAKCHSGSMFSDYALHVLSVPDNTLLPTDAGAGGTYSFRTPSLRNLSRTGPFMHSGVFSSLDAVLDFYEQVGGRRPQNPHVAAIQLDANLQRLNDRDKTVIIDFLSALNDESFDRSIPPTVPSGLHPGGNL